MFKKNYVLSEESEILVFRGIVGAVVCLVSLIFWGVTFLNIPEEIAKAKALVIAGVLGAAAIAAGVILVRASYKENEWLNTVNAQFNRVLELYNFEQRMRIAVLGDVESMALNLIELHLARPEEGFAIYKPREVAYYAMACLARAMRMRANQTEKLLNEKGVDSEEYQSANDAFKAAKNRYWEMSEALVYEPFDRPQKKSWKEDVPMYMERAPR